MPSKSSEMEERVQLAFAGLRSIKYSNMALPHAILARHMTASKIASKAEHPLLHDHSVNSHSLRQMKMALLSGFVAGIRLEAVQPERISKMSVIRYLLRILTHLGPTYLSVLITGLLTS
jgi:hypothetical protein